MLSSPEGATTAPAVAAPAATAPAATAPAATAPARPPFEGQTDLAFRGTLTPETEFVLLSARTRLQGARQRRWEALLDASTHASADNAGADNAGADNASADNNAGADNAGADNAGADNAGADNAGADNAGADNAGADNAGADNAGADNAGADNAGADNAGAVGVVGLDWEAVLRLAGAHRVLGLLGRHLSARAWKGVPDGVRVELQNYFLYVTRHSSALKGELARVSHLLEAAGVPVLSFKGTTLGLTAYGNAVVRPSADLDLLVARADVLRARDLLGRAGYAPEVALPLSQEAHALRQDSVFNLARPAEARLHNVLPQGYVVELHWAITSPCLPFGLEYETVAPRLGWIDLPGVPGSGAGAAAGGVAAPALRPLVESAPDSKPFFPPYAPSRVRALAPEDLLLILCVHGAKHLWERLIWLCDLAELVDKTPDLNWERVLELARARGVQRMTALGLTLARDVLGTPLPRALEQWLSTQPEALRLAAQLRRKLLVSPPPNAPQPGALAGHALADDARLMQTIDSPWHRLGFLWHLLTVPTLGERAALDLPARLNFLWWIVRPARVLQKRLLAKPRN